MRSLLRECRVAALDASVLEYLGPVLDVEEDILLNSFHLLLLFGLQHLFHGELGVRVLLVHVKTLDAFYV